MRMLLDHAGPGPPGGVRRASMNFDIHRFAGASPTPHLAFGHGPH
ncbi:hypothetical protein [Nonomuraea sp. NPDC002799]